MSGHGFSAGLAAPWAPGARLASVPGSMILKVALGEAPAGIPAQNDVRAFAAEAARGIDGGPIDRLVEHWGGTPRIARLHTAAASHGKVGRRHHDYDDVEHTTGIARTFRVDLPKEAALGSLVDALRQVRTVEAASLNFLTATPFADAIDPGADEDDAWASRDLIFAAEAMAYEPGDPAIIVGLVDSGVALDHPELDGRLRAGFDCVHLGQADLASGMKFLGDVDVTDTSPLDRFVGHGTCCAGIIGASGDRIPPGLAGLCQILPVRVLGAAAMPGRRDPVGIGAIADIDVGLKWAVDLGAKVINCSFGTADSGLEGHGPKPHQDVVRYAAARGCILVAASGNSGAEERFWPAAFPEVIAVGAVSKTGVPTAFTTRGAHVALSAPGERVVSTGLSGYQYATGTSFASPFVAAAAALLCARAARRSSPMDGPRVRALLVGTATPFSAAAPGCGSGILNVAGALRALEKGIDTTPPGESVEAEIGIAA
jgi:subtilisin family serine protease